MSGGRKKSMNLNSDHGLVEVSDVTVTPSSVVPMQNFGKLPRKATVIL